MMRLLRTLLAVLAGAGAVSALRRRKTRRPAGQRRAEAEDVRPGIRQRLVTIAAFVGVVAMGGLFVVVSGIVPIKASSGHWRITAWFMSFAMERSVATHTLGGRDAPPLDDQGLVLRGAGHYETGCRPCHGSPELPRPRIAAEMTPHPPFLSSEIEKWEPDELFYIVKHGVKFTGMPAWPTQQRDDEVWAMVAFLKRLPELDAAAYRRLVAGGLADRTGGVREDVDEAAPLPALVAPDDVPGAVTRSCGRCHGVEGLGRGAGAFPRLAGQQATYLYAALRAYAHGDRPSGVMGPVAAGLSLEEMQTLARYYADRPVRALPAGDARPDSAAVGAVERGRRIAHDGVPAERIPSCVDCHGPGTTARNPAYPDLAGQYADYLFQQLELFKEGHRGGSAYGHLMRPVAGRLTKEQMRDVAAYYASLSPGAAAAP